MVRVVLLLVSTAVTSGMPADPRLVQSLTDRGRSMLTASDFGVGPEIQPEPVPVELLPHCRDFCTSPFPQYKSPARGVNIPVPKGIFLLHMDEGTCQRYYHTNLIMTDVQCPSECQQYCCERSGLFENLSLCAVAPDGGMMPNGDRGWCEYQYCAGEIPFWWNDSRASIAIFGGGPRGDLNRIRSITKRRPDLVSFFEDRVASLLRQLRRGSTQEIPDDSPVVSRGRFSDFRASIDGFVCFTAQGRLVVEGFINDRPEWSTVDDVVRSFSVQQWLDFGPTAGMVQICDSANMAAAFDAAAARAAAASAAAAEPNDEIAEIDGVVTIEEARAEAELQVAAAMADGIEFDTVEVDASGPMPEFPFWLWSDADVVANEGPSGTRSADEAFNLRGSQEDHDRVMAVPVHERKTELERIRAEISAANGIEGPSGTSSADEAFNLRGSQEDYDRVMAVPVHEREAELELIRAEIAG